MSTNNEQVDSSNGGTTSVSSSDQLPNSRKIYLTGQLHPDIRVPFREISLAQTKTMSGEMEVNEPVRVYDTSGAWGDADQHVDVTQGLSSLRSNWIRDRGDVEEINGRRVTPIDDGYLSVSHAEHSAKRNGNGQSDSQLLAPSSKLPRRP